MTDTTPKEEPEQILDTQYDLIKSTLTSEQRQAVKIYRKVLQYLGVDNVVNKSNPVLSPDMIDIKSSPYVSLGKDQLMYYIGVLCGIRPYLCEELTDAKARAIYATVWRKFNEVGFKVSFRKNKLSQEIEKLEKKITARTGKQSNITGIKKHYTEDYLKDEATWRTYTWSKIEGEKIRKAELLVQYLSSIDNLIVALKERIRYSEPEKGQAGYGNEANTISMP